MSKPRCSFKGVKKDIFSLTDEVEKVLRNAKQGDKIPEMLKRVYSASGYLAALEVIKEYVEVDQ